MQKKNLYLVYYFISTKQNKILNVEDLVIIIILIDNNLVIKKIANNKLVQFEVIKT